VIPDQCVGGDPVAAAEVPACVTSGARLSRAQWSRLDFDLFEYQLRRRFESDIAFVL